MTDQPQAGNKAIEALLRDLEEAKEGLFGVVSQVTDPEFAWEPPAGDSIKQTLDKTANDISFFYGWLVIRVRGLPLFPASRLLTFHRYAKPQWFCRSPIVASPTSCTT